MLDFFQISRRHVKKNVVEIFPKFIVKSNSNDLMIRGRDFYAVWDEDQKMWSQDEQSVIDQVDKEVEKEYLGLIEWSKKQPDLAETTYVPKYMWDSDSGVIDKWHKYVQKQCRDKYHQLNEKVMFSNSPYNKRDYSSKRLDYPLEDGDISAYEELISTLYDPEERDKLEWAIGSIVAGDSKKIQKFIFLYGAGGTGKSTFLDIVKWLFDGYYCVFEAKDLGNSNSSFALESFKENPLVGIDAEADISRLNDNTKINSIVAHESMEINEKFKSKYTAKFNAFLFMGSNNMVNITDARSGMVRRLIDVMPTGQLIEFERYLQLMDQIKEQELGHIAKHCLDRYNALGSNYYSKYVPTRMIEGTNEFYNFMLERYFEYKDSPDGLSLDLIWGDYGKYCDEANVQYKMTKRKVRTELMEYFEDYKPDVYEGGNHRRSVFYKLKISKFRRSEPEKLKAIPNKIDIWLDLKDYSEFETNVFNETFKDCPAQYAVGEGSEKPSTSWAKVETKLSDIDTSKVHYVRKPIQFISVDFDGKDENGNKSLERNIELALSWPPTYAEISKGGRGLHLEYEYIGDAGKLAGRYDNDIEIKVCSGLSSCRRRLSKCNNLPIAKISSGLPLKGAKKMVNTNAIKTEKTLRKFVLACLEKKHHGATAPEINFISEKLEEVYESGLHYDISDMQPSVMAFAAGSTHQAQKCMNIVDKMHFKSDDISEPEDYSDDSNAIVFFDVEVFPNLFVLCFKFDGEKTIPLINPSGDDIWKLCKYRLIGFNNRKYDNHILYARMHGYTNKQLYNLSQKIINDKIGFFNEAYNLSYTDIYDFASAGNKMSLKKWEIKLGIHHLELGLPWDQDVPEDIWDKVAEYCCNDVDATEAAFHCDELHADFVAREILADIADMTPNDTTNQLTTRIIFGNDKNPQKDFVYTDLSELFPGYEYNKFGIDKSRYTGKIVNGKSIYRGIDPSEGGRVYAEPGMYFNVALLDIASMHPSSIENLNLFGPYTKNFSDIKLARLLIKHKEYDKAKELFEGKLAKYLDDPAMAKSLSTALKTAINSVYGLTSASFENKFKDPRNVDNIVAKRGALFMIELQLTLQKMGYKVAHVKTDSIKIPEATPEVIQFVMDFGKKYGYEFEHEATYDRLCLVNESTYIAKDAADGHWTATGAQFQIPYVFKTLFSHEPILFEDMCETKSVTSALYLDFNEGLPENEHQYSFVGRVGLFCPMQEGAGGGLLLREKDGKYNSATGAKGYRWMESEMVKALHLEDKIDRSYYERLVDEARETINQFGDFEMFVSDTQIPELPF